MNPNPGSVISYSAGTTGINPMSFRVIEHGGNDRLFDVVQCFPRLAEFLSAPPLVLSCYPTTLGVFPTAVFCDTYLQEKTFSRGLLLATSSGLAPIIIGQPLAIADLLYKHQKASRSFPRRLVIGMGGYHCPASLERWICQILAESGCETLVLHAYGLGEVDFAILIGMRNSSGQIPYQQVVSSVEIELRGKELWMRRRGSEQFFPTGDDAVFEGGNFSITNHPRRLSHEVLAELESWTDQDWSRRTGYLVNNNSSPDLPPGPENRSSPKKMIFQCREDAAPSGPQELDYFDFVRSHGMSYFNKPNWS